MHMVMHMVVAMLVPLLLVPAAPILLALRALPSRPDKTWGPREVVLQVVHSRLFKVLANPVVAAALFFFSLAIFYYSPLFELALRTHTGHVLMMVHFLLTGYLFAWVLIGIDPGPKKWPPLMLLVVLFATMSFHAFFGVVMTGSTTLLAPDFFEALKLPWMTDPLGNQREAGAIAWGIGEAPTLILTLLVAVAWVRTDRAETTRKDRQADRDGDAELAAYNAHLQELKRRDEQRNRPRRGQPDEDLRDEPGKELTMRVAVLQVGYGDDEPMADRVDAGRRPRACAGRARPGRAARAVGAGGLLLPRVGGSCPAGRRPDRHRDVCGGPRRGGPPPRRLHRRTSARRARSARTATDSGTPRSSTPGRKSRRGIPQDPPVRLRLRGAEAHGRR